MGAAVVEGALVVVALVGAVLEAAPLVEGPALVPVGPVPDTGKPAAGPADEP